MLNSKRVFVLSPHPDDLEFGCGGIVSRLIVRGANVVSIVFSMDEDREKELLVATAVMGIQKVVTLKLPVRRLPNYRQGILEKLVALKEKYKPDLVIQPSLNDMHQDHQVVAEEGLRVFKDTNLIGFEEPWNNLNFDAQLFVRLDSTHLDKKVKAIGCYKSQAHKAYASEEYTRSLAKVRGVQAGVDNAEMFSVIRQVIA